MGDRIAEQAAHLDVAMHGLLSDLRAFDRGGGWAPQGATSCAHWLSWRVGWTLSTARDRLRVADRLGELPEISAALAKGSLSYSKVRAMTRVATPVNETTILTAAMTATAAQLERICRSYASVKRGVAAENRGADLRRRYVRRRTTDDGMVCIEAMLHPEEAATVWLALDRVAKGLAAGASSEVLVPRELEDDFEEDSEKESTIERQSPSASAESSTAGPGPEVVTEPAGGCAEERDPAAVWSMLDEFADWPQPIDPSIYEGNDSDAEPTTSTTSVAWKRSAVSCTDERAMHERARRQERFNRANALVAMAQAVVRGDRLHRAPVDVCIAVPAETLRATETMGVGVLDDGTCVSAHAARRMSCDAGLVHVREQDDGAMLSVGRKTRSIPSAIKRALQRRDRDTCRYPGCTHRAFLEGHHIEHWARGGETSLANLVLLCSHHHRFVHEYGYSITHATDGSPRFHYPDGDVIPDQPPAPKPATPLGLATIRANNAALHITSRTNECGWDGRPLDLGLAVDDLVRSYGV